MRTYLPRNLKPGKVSKFSLLAGLGVVVCFAFVACASAPDRTLKIGYLADFSGPLAEFGPEIQTGVQLAIDHINAGGGVFGKNVELITGDTALESAQAIQEARRLIDVEGVAAIIGPLASSTTLAVAESVAADAEIPIISPSATAPTITDAQDNDFLFRATLSDAAQGVVLAELVEGDGIDNVAVLYINNAYGQGLINRFESAFGGTVTAASHEDNQVSYLAELQRVKRGGADYLIAMGYSGQAQVYLREALELDLFDKFYFVDGTRSEDLIDSIGADRLEGFKGTVSSSDESTASFSNFNVEYQAKHGALPTRPYVREAYDATIAVALAAVDAGSDSGGDIRDNLRDVAAPGGTLVSAGSVSIAEALRLVRNDNEVNYEGAATSLDWNEKGDVASGFVSIWAYQGGAIVDLQGVPVNLR